MVENLNLHPDDHKIGLLFLNYEGICQFLGSPRFGDTQVNVIILVTVNGTAFVCKEIAEVQLATKT